jgi:hypothetical protein
MKRSSLISTACGFLIATGLVLACNDAPTGASTTTTYPVGGMVTGLVGSGLVLRNNGRDDLSVTANGPVVFATPLANGASYSVTVLTQPARPPQTCIVAGGTGTVVHANITSVGIFCAANTYTVGGTVSGLVGTGLVLHNNGGDDLAVSGNGPVTFATSLSSGAAYGVTVFQQPTSPAQSCVVTDGSGTVATANVTNVAITCATNTNIYTVGGTVSGLVGSALVLRDNGGDDLSVTANGSFTFTTPLSSGVGYAVTVFTQPTSPAQTCTVTNGNGTVGAANITTVVIACTTGTPRLYAVGGTISGLAGSGLVLRNNGGDDLAVTANGPFAFTTPLSTGAAYDVTVFTQPTLAQTCVVTNGNGTVATANVTNVAIACVTNSGTGTIRVTMATTGPDAPATFPVGVDPGGPSGYWYSADVPSNGTVSIAVAPGTHRVFMILALRNCRLSANGVSVTVVAGATTDVAFSVTCVALGTINVTVVTTGASVPVSYGVSADEPFSYYHYGAPIPSNGSTSLRVAAGYYTVRLHVPSNCTVHPDPGGVGVASGATVAIAFQVTCASAAVRITAATTGPNAPATYSVVVNPDYVSVAIAANGTVSISLPPGGHTVSLGVPQNCSVTSPNNVFVNLQAGTTSNLAFTVTCR